MRPWEIGEITDIAVRTNNHLQLSDNATER